MTNLNFGTVQDYSEHLRRIREWTQRLRKLRPPRKDRWEEPSDWVIKDANIHGSPVRSLTITLTPTGCAWARESGGCTMCGEYEGSTKGKILPPEFHIAQFAMAVSRYVPEYEPSWLRIYQEGNYTNKDEISKSVRRSILQLSSMIRGLRRITIESMAKYMTREVVQELASAIVGDVELEVGMGFEAENQVVRNVCINKGESLEDFRSAIALLGDAEIRSLAYVLLKPPFLTEGEAIEEAIATIRLANEIGFDAISLEPLSIHRYTLAHALNLEGLCHPPWLWSVLEVAQTARDIQDFRIGGVGYYPRPTNVAHNRHTDGDDGCNKAFWAAIKEYGRSRSFAVFDGLTCDCRAEWEKDCRIRDVPLPERINRQLDSLDFDRYAQLVSNGHPLRPRLVHEALPSIGGTQFPQEG